MTRTLRHRGANGEFIEHEPQLCGEKGCNMEASYFIIEEDKPDKYICADHIPEGMEEADNLAKYSCHEDCDICAES